MINVFAIFASEDGNQLLSCLYVAIFQFYAEKCPTDTEYAEGSELCGSAPLHPVRCTVYIMYHNFNTPKINANFNRSNNSTGCNCFWITGLRKQNNGFHIKAYLNDLSHLSLRRQVGILLIALEIGLFQQQFSIHGQHGALTVNLSGKIFSRGQQQ